MIPRRKHNASAGSLAPDFKHASNDYILSAGSEEGCGGVGAVWAAVRKRMTKKTLHRRLPFTAWLPKYTTQQLVGDLIAGVTVGLTVIPQSLAYSSIAGLPPQMGLYGAFLPPIIYALLGGCRAVPAGPTAIASLLTWQVCGGVMEKAVVLTLLSGCVTLLLGVLRLGFLVDFVSGPVFSGFTSAVALLIATSQVKDLFGITVGGGTFVEQWVSVFRNIHRARLWDPVLGFSCVALLLLMRKIGMVKADEGANARKRFLAKCCWLLGTCRNAIVVVFSGGLAYWFVTTKGEAPFRLMGDIPGGIPSPTIPAFSYTRDNSTVDFMGMMRELGSGIVVIPLIVLLEDIAICKAFSEGKTIDATQEMLALGVSGVVNAFVGAYPGGGSLARSVVAANSGARTPAHGIVTSFLVLLALQLFTAHFAYIPRAALAAVIVSAIIFMVEYHVVKPMWRAKKLDLVPGLGTFLLCLLLPLELGILAGIALNLVFILYHAARPKVSVETLTTPRGVEYLMVTPDRSLMFPSVDYVRKLVSKCAAGARVPVVLECTHIYSADYTAARSIEQLAADFRARQQPLYFYNVKPSVAAVFEALTQPDHFVVFYEDHELDGLLARDDPQDAKTQPHTHV